MAKTRKEFAAEFARKGAKARAKSLTPEQRKEIARKAAVARWGKKTKGDTQI
jgi:general stress protein YciG